MYNAKYIIPGILVFIVVMTVPFWINLASPAYSYPDVPLPKGQGMEECVEPGQWMRANHMELLNQWRDEALRNSKRVYVSTSGKEWNVSLQNTCMSCHADKVEFCDKCHNANSVSPYCWDCHVAPQGNNQ